MGNCMSATAVDISDDDKRRHREAEKSLKEVGVTHSADICGSLSKYPLGTWRVVSGEAKVSLTSQGALVLPNPETISEPCMLGITIRIRRFGKIYYPQGG
jgi:hypothetical protein